MTKPRTGTHARTRHGFASRRTTIRTMIHAQHTRPPSPPGAPGKENAHPGGCTMHAPTSAHIPFHPPRGRAPCLPASTRRTMRARCRPDRTCIPRVRVPQYGRAQHTQVFHHDSASCHDAAEKGARTSTQRQQNRVFAPPQQLYWRRDRLARNYRKLQPRRDVASTGPPRPRHQSPRR
jgi:hypothetical protein